MVRDRHSQVAEAASLEPLDSMDLPDGQREVRIWISGSKFYPQWVHRFINDGRAVSGETVLFWPTSQEPDETGETSHERFIHSRTGACHDFQTVGSFGTCRALFDKEIAWERRLEKLERSMIWLLPDAGELPKEENNYLVLGSGVYSMTVELRDGEKYRSYRYRLDDFDRDLPETRFANEIRSVVFDIHRQVRTADIVRPYRGVTSGEFRSAFAICGGEDVWDVRFHLESLAHHSRIDIPEPGPYGYLIEIIGSPSTPGLAIQWDSEFERVFQARTLLSIEPALKPEC